MIAQELGVRPPWVHRLREELGLEGNPHPLWDKAAARTLYDLGLRDAEIGNELGVARLTVFKWRQSERLPAHPRRRAEAPAATH
jgi:hypothetical protein